LVIVVVVLWSDAAAQEIERRVKLSLRTPVACRSAAAREVPMRERSSWPASGRAADPIGVDWRARQYQHSATEVALPGAGPTVFR
jgi:hypothetical protein